MRKDMTYEKKHRMRAKAMLCVVAILLLLFLGIRYGSSEREEVKWQEPVITYLHNVYVEEITDTYITVFDTERIKLLWQENMIPPDAGGVGHIADVTITDGLMSALVIKDENKINDKVVAVERTNGVELENAGFLAFDENVKIYMLYGQLRTGTTGDIRIGYEFADFVIEEGRICAVLLTKEEAMPYIRVLIQTSDYAGKYHDKITLSADAPYVLRYGKDGEMTEEEYESGEEVTIGKESVCFQNEANRVYIVPKALTGKVSLLSVKRSMGAPSYRGTMEIISTDEGLVLINEVLLEEYLYSVVPSEMPASYPLEALKAQAICARTYAYSHMLHPGLPSVGAHVDDGTGYQVYNNIAEQNAATTAVKETAGQLLYTQGEPVSTYYYSTSCGFGSDEHVWKSESAPELPYLSATSLSKEAMDSSISGTEYHSIYTAESMQQEEMFAQFLSYPPDTDFEKEESWYRWWYEVPDMDSEKILENVKARYAANHNLVLTLKDGMYVSAPIERLGKIKSIVVAKRGAGGVAEELIIEGDKGTYKVLSELFIRYVLCNGKTQVRRGDGSMVDMTSLLPSAFFVLTPVSQEGEMTGYILYGGGFGHGAGMSQNAAKNMAKAGYTAQQILYFFYKNCIITTTQ